MTLCIGNWSYIMGHILFSMLKVANPTIYWGLADNISEGGRLDARQWGRVETMGNSYYQAAPASDCYDRSIVAKTSCFQEKTEM